MSKERVVALETAIPILPVTDLSEALDYYQRVLGFEIAWTWGEPPQLASVCRDRIEFNLAHRPGLSQTASGEPGADKVYVRMAGIDEFYRTIKAAGAEVIVPLDDRHYGLRDFRLADPSGNEISFGEVIGD